MRLKCSIVSGLRLCMWRLFCSLAWLLVVRLSPVYPSRYSSSASKHTAITLAGRISCHSPCAPAGGLGASIGAAWSELASLFLSRLPHCAFCCFTARSPCNWSACLLLNRRRAHAHAVLRDACIVQPSSHRRCQLVSQPAKQRAGTKANHHHLMNLRIRCVRAYACV